MKQISSVYGYVFVIEGKGKDIRQTDILIYRNDHQPYQNIYGSNEIIRGFLQSVRYISFDIETNQDQPDNTLIDIAKRKPKNYL